MTYERMTASGTAEALRLAEEILTARLPVKKMSGDRHSVKLSGGDGTVTITAHRHGLSTVVHAATDQLRTSRLDMDVQYYMTMLPYQPNDQRGVGTALPGGLSRA
ncbi:MAG: hypothetical protein ABIV28_07010 [Longimicrobiales bacterium]